jgi:hypothetical protein
MVTMSEEFDMDEYKKELSEKIERDRISRLAEHGISNRPGTCVRCQAETIPEVVLCSNCITALLSEPRDLREFDMTDYRRELAEKCNKERTARIDDYETPFGQTPCVRCYADSIPVLYLHGKCYDNILQIKKAEQRRKS